MTPDDVLTLAREGHPKILAAIMNRTTQPRGIQVRVARKDSTLHVLLEGEAIANSAPLTAFVQSSLKKLKVNPDYTVRVYGRQVGQQSVAWSQTLQRLELKSSVNPAGVLENPEASVHNASDESVQSSQETGIIASTVVSTVSTNVTVSAQFKEVSPIADPWAPSPAAALESDAGSPDGSVNSRDSTNTENLNTENLEPDVPEPGVSYSEWTESDPAIVESDMHPNMQPEMQPDMQSQMESPMEPTEAIAEAPMQSSAEPSPFMPSPASMPTPADEPPMTDQAEMDTTVAEQFDRLEQDLTAAESPATPEREDVQDLLKRPEALAIILFVIAFYIWQLYTSLMESAAPEGSVSGRELAERLGVSQSTISRRKLEDDFAAWTATLDPDGLAWAYTAGMFVPQIPDFEEV